MWNLSLVIINICVLTIVSSDPGNYNIGIKDTARHHETSNHQKSDQSNNYYDKDQYSQNSDNRRPQSTPNLRDHDYRRLSPLLPHHHCGPTPREDKPATPLNGHSPNDYNKPPYYNRPPLLRDNKRYRKSDYNRYKRQSKYDGNSRYKREHSPPPRFDVYPPELRYDRAPQLGESTPDDYDDDLSPLYPRGPPFTPHHRRPPPGTGPRFPPQHRGPHPPPQERGPPPPPYHRGPPLPPHHNGPPPPPHRRGPPPPLHHRGPPSRPHHGDPPQRPPPPAFTDDEPPTTAKWHKDTPNDPNIDQVPPRKHQSGSELQTMESVPDDNSNSGTSTTEEEFMIDVRFGNEEMGKQ